MFGINQTEQNFTKKNYQNFNVNETMANLNNSFITILL